MKNLKNFYLTLFAFSSILSCSDSNELLETESATTKSAVNEFGFTKEESLIIVQNAKLDMISFVDGVSEFYEPGDSYQELKSKLDPVTNLESMHPAANKLLFKAYSHLDSGKSPSQLNGVELMEMFYVMLLNAEQRGIENTSEIDLDLESLELWGSSEENLAKKKCRWFQIGCHISNAWAWLGGGSNGNGGQTNGQILRDTITAAAAIVGLILAL